MSDPKVLSPLTTQKQNPNFPPKTSTNLQSSLPKTLSALKSPNKLALLHSLLITSGPSVSNFVAGKLISMYSEFSNPAASLAVFLSTPNSNHNVYLWNTLIRMFTQNALFSEALDKYNEMRRKRLPPASFTFPSVLAACAGMGAFESARRVHRDALEIGFGSDLYITNTLINVYSRLGAVADAREMFDGMPVRDVVSWNSLISGCIANGAWEEALEFYREMRVAGVVPDCFTVESVLPAIGGLGHVEEGKTVHGLVNKIGV